MSQPVEPPNPPLSSASRSTTRLSSSPTQSRRGCGSQLFGLLSWVLTVILSAALGIAALAAIAYFLFDFDLTTPAQFRQSSTEVTLLSTSAADSSRQLAAATKRVGELEAQVTRFAQQSNALADQAATAAVLSRELHESIDLAKTIQAEGRQGQVFVAVVATTQADSAARLSELQRRTERISRFLERLGDLAGDVANDTTPPPAVTPTLTSPTTTPTIRSLSATPTVKP